MQTFNAKNVRDRDRIPFEIFVPGTDDNAVEARTETFHVNGYMPAWLILECDAAEGRRNSSQKYLEFFKYAVVKDEQVRWRAFVRDPENGIDNTVLSEIYNWIYEVYANLPTQEDESSSTGPDELTTSTEG